MSTAIVAKEAAHLAEQAALNALQRTGATQLLGNFGLKDAVIASVVANTAVEAGPKIISQTWNGITGLFKGRKQKKEENKALAEVERLKTEMAQLQKQLAQTHNTTPGDVKRHNIQVKSTQLGNLRSNRASLKI